MIVLLCTIRDCGRPALWTVAAPKHPNAPGFTAHYCHEHLRIPTWEDSPTSYTITVTGPHQA